MASVLRAQGINGARIDRRPGIGTLVEAVRLSHGVRAIERHEHRSTRPYRD
jgi:hypothetical protein